MNIIETSEIYAEMSFDEDSLVENAENIAYPLFATADEMKQFCATVNQQQNQ